MFKMFSIILTRHFVRNKASAILNITGLAIGICTCLIITIWAERELSFDTFHKNAGGKFRIWNTFKSEAETFSQAPSGVALGAHLSKHIPQITNSCRIFPSGSKVGHGSQVNFEQQVIFADSTFFSFFGFDIIAGPEKIILTNPDHVVITRETAVRYFGSVEDAIGQALQMDDQAVTVAAIVEDPPPNTHIDFSIIVPYKALHSYALREWKQDLDNMWVGGWPNTYIELNDASQRMEVEGLVNQVVAEHSKKEWTDNKMSYQYFLQPIRDIHLHSSLRYDAANNGSIATVRVFIAVAVLVLLLACFNYINLTTATSVRRAKEIALRKVAGANRAELIRQFFSETFLTTVIAVMIGVALAQMMLPYFSIWMGQSYHLPVDLFHVGALVMFILVVTLLSGIYPAIVLSSFQPIAGLRGKFFSSASGQSFRQALVVFQFSISTVLLISILTVNRQMQYINSKSLGYDQSGVITVDFNGDNSVQKNYDAIRDALVSVPFIEEASLHQGNVVGGLGNGWISTRDLKDKEIVTSIYRMAVDPEYFKTYRMKIIAGREFRHATSDSSKAVIVNEAAVKNLGWNNPGNALGKPFGTGDDIRYVIGVVEDFHFENLHAIVQPLLIGYAQGGSTLSLRVRTDHVEDALEHLQVVWSKIVPEVPLQFSFVGETLERQYANERKMEVIFYIFAALSFFVACLGLFGLSTFMIRQRAQEITIRKVLGASISGLVMLLTKDFTKLVLLSVLIAFPIGWFVMNKWLSTFVYHTGMGWVVPVIAVVVPVLISFFTICGQAIKAALVNAAKMLRAE